MAGVWTHRDEALSEHLASGYSRAASGDWGSGSLAARVDAFRALVADTAGVMAWFSGTTQIIAGEGGARAVFDVRPAPATPAERVAVAGRLYATFKAFQVTADGGLDGDIVTSAGTEAAGVLAGVAVVAVIALGAVALGYCAHESAVVVDRHLARQEDSKRMMMQHAQVLKLVHQHQEREEQTGAALPLDAATRTALDDLGKSQLALVAKREEPFPSFLGNQSNEPGSWLDYAKWAALAAAGYLLLKGG